MNAKVKQLGQAQMGLLVGLSGLIASIAAPILYVGGIKEVNAVQDQKLAAQEIKITKFEDKVEDLVTKDDLKELKNDLKTLYNQQAAILQSLRSNPNY